MREFYSASEEETEALGAMIAKECAPSDFVALYGEMGSGKTVFVRGFVKTLVPEARVSSPTYAVLNVYEGKEHVINHFDMFRISSEEDLYSTGYEEVLDQGITLCEWPENIPESLPSSYLKIVFEKDGEKGRRLFVERILNADSWY